MGTLDAFLNELHEKGSVTFAVRVRPAAPRSTIVSVLEDETVKIDLAAPATDGKANAELIRLLADQFDVQRPQVHIVTGKTSRQKLVRISS